MFCLILTLAGVVTAVLPTLVPRRIPPPLGRIIGVAVALFAFFSTSFVVIDSNAVGQMKRIYFGNAMPPGRVIALRGESEGRTRRARARQNHRERFWTAQLVALATKGRMPFANRSLHTSK